MAESKLNTDPTRTAPPATKKLPTIIGARLNLSWAGCQLASVINRLKPTSRIAGPASLNTTTTTAHTITLAVSAAPQSSRRTLSSTLRGFETRFVVKRNVGKILDEIIDGL
jgi:hypothetical protein